MSLVILMCLNHNDSALAKMTQAESQLYNSGISSQNLIQKEENLGNNPVEISQDLKMRSNHSISNLERKTRALATYTKMLQQKVSQRLSHAKELMGKRYQKSIVQASEGMLSIDYFLQDLIKAELRKKWKNSAKKISKAIIVESEKYGFDPIFLVAMIENESSFNPEAVGGSGEIGLMQLTPATGKWISDRFGLPWKGKKTLQDPVANIQFGAAYLAYLRERFDFHSQLYLAAYNMGTSNVIHAIERQVWPKDYPSRVIKHYVKLYSKLSKESASLN